VERSDGVFRVPIAMMGGLVCAVFVMMMSRVLFKSGDSFVLNRVLFDGPFFIIKLTFAVLLLLSQNILSTTRSQNHKITKSQKKSQICDHLITK
jgi:hypothetical protein